MMSSQGLILFCFFGVSWMLKDCQSTRRSKEDEPRRHAKQRRAGLRLPTLHQNIATLSRSTPGTFVQVFVLKIIPSRTNKIIPSRTNKEERMRVYPLLTFGALLVLVGAPALAGRAVTDDERAKLVSAISAQGCSGGKMEFDDGKYEVDNARCNDGKIYDLDFNRSFELLKKKLEN
jgi:hypothetical protein